MTYQYDKWLKLTPAGRCAYETDFSLTYDERAACAYEAKRRIEAGWVTPSRNSHEVERAVDEMVPLVDDESAGFQEGQGTLVDVSGECLICGQCGEAQCMCDASEFESADAVEHSFDEDLEDMPGLETEMIDSDSEAFLPADWDVYRYNPPSVNGEGPGPMRTSRLTVDEKAQNRDFFATSRLASSTVLVQAIETRPAFVHGVRFRMREVFAIQGGTAKRPLVVRAVSVTDPMRAHGVENDVLGLKRWAVPFKRYIVRAFNVNIQCVNNERKPVSVFLGISHTHPSQDDTLANAVSRSVDSKQRIVGPGASDVLFLRGDMLTIRGRHQGISSMAAGHCDDSRVPASPLWVVYGYDSLKKYSKNGVTFVVTVDYVIDFGSPQDGPAPPQTQKNGVDVTPVDWGDSDEHCSEDDIVDEATTDALE